MAKSTECKCDPKFTCGYCLRNMKPWFWTSEDGRRSYTVTMPLMGAVAATGGRRERQEEGR